MKAFYLFAWLGVYLFSIGESFGVAFADQDLRTSKTLSQVNHIDGHMRPDLGQFFQNSSSYHDFSILENMPLADGNGSYTGGEIFSKVCASCHGFDASGGVLNIPLNTKRDLAAMIEIIEQRMPFGNPQNCDATCAERVGNYIADTFWAEELPEDCSMVKYGARQLKILTKSEYQNSVRDLIGINYNVSESLSADNRVGYFTNNTFTSIVVATYEAYLNVAEEVAAWSADRNFSPLLNCQNFDQNCANRFINTAAPKIFRRTLNSREREIYTNMANGTLTNGDVKAGLQLALAGMLSSPQFLYRHEIGELNRSNGEIDFNAYELTSYEMATWLSFSLTGSTPDATALQKAANNELRNPNNIRAEARRLLNSPRARSTMGNFVGNWLGTDQLENTPKDSEKWPEFQQLIPHLKQEIRENFAEVMLNRNENFGSIYNASWTYLNAPLAEHYGISGISGNEFRRVNVNDRGGILANGAFMSRWGESIETSPIRRSVRVRRRMLCENQPNPPGNIAEGREEQIKKHAEVLRDPRTTNRMKYAIITDTQPCVNCHQEWINPLGFGMEDFNTVGKIRFADLRGNTIDASGILYAPENLSDRDVSISFYGTRELGALFANLPSAQSCVSKNLFRYMMGVGHDSIDNTNPLGPELSSRERDGYACTVQQMTDTMVHQSPFELLVNLGTLETVRYRKNWVR